MPEPVFRSTEGFTPKTALHSVQDEIPTEPGFSDDETEEDITLPDARDNSGDEEKGGQSVRATTKTRVRHAKKKTGCAKIFGLLAGAIVLSAAAVVVILIYFLFYFRPTDTGTF